MLVLVSMLARLKMLNHVFVFVEAAEIIQRLNSLSPLCLWLYRMYVYHSKQILK